MLRVLGGTFNISSIEFLFKYFTFHCFYNMLRSDLYFVQLRFKAERISKFQLVKILYIFTKLSSVFVIVFLPFILIRTFKTEIYLGMKTFSWKIAQKFTTKVEEEGKNE